MYLGSSPSALAKGVIMVKSFNLVQNDDALENEMVVSLYSGETINLVLKMNFDYVKANVRVNDIFIGTTANGQIGIHSSRIKSGYNEISIDFLDTQNQIIKTLKYKFASVPNLKSNVSLSEAYENLISEFELLKNRIAELENWKQEIDNERSGY